MLSEISGKEAVRSLVFGTQKTGYAIKSVLLERPGCEVMPPLTTWRCRQDKSSGGIEDGCYPDFALM